MSVENQYEQWALLPGKRWLEREAEHLTPSSIVVIHTYKLAVSTDRD